MVPGLRGRLPHPGEKGGADTGPSPVDRRKTGSKHHLICDGRGTPLKVITTAANVNDVTQTLALVAGIPLVAGRPGRPRRPMGTTHRTPRRLRLPRLRPDLLPTPQEDPLMIVLRALKAQNTSGLSPTPQLETCITARTPCACHKRSFPGSKPYATPRCPWVLRVSCARSYAPFGDADEGAFRCQAADYA
ncbi:transposase [Streptomyces anulatus]